MRGYATMLSIGWRGGRRLILGWTLGLAVVFVATAWSLHNMYDTPAGLADYARLTRSSDALYSINGRPYGLTDIGGVIAYEFGFISAVAYPLMGIHLVVRMTRAEEQSGRLESLRAGTVGRTAPVVAALTLCAGAMVAVALPMAATLIALGLGWPGVVLYPLSIALLGLCFGAIGAVAAQTVGSARVVTAIGTGVLVVAYLARGVGDVRDNALVWLSPIGWAEQTRPFGEARWWPILPALAVSVLLAATAAWLAGRRDLGEGLFSSGRGPTRAAPSSLDPIGFAFRWHRGAILAWSVLGALVGMSFGAVADAFQTAVHDNSSLRDLFGGTGEDAYVAFVVVLLALICAGFGLRGVGRMAEEENTDRLEPMLAGGVSRGRWLAGHGAAIVTGSVVVAAVGALALGLGYATAVGDAGAVGRLMWATLGYVPAVLTPPALAVALYGVRPSLLGLGWWVFAALTVIAVLGDTLRLPNWARDLSPLTWVGQAPADPVRWWAPIAAAAIAALLASIGLLAFRRRDVPSPTDAVFRLRPFRAVGSASE